MSSRSQFNVKNFIEKEFNNWLSKFFPSFKEENFGSIITPPEVLDPKDPGIGHLIGLMFHRAWTLNDVANKIQNDDKKLFLYKISKNHTKKGFELMFDSGYGGEHWLATFAIYNFTR